MDQAASLTPRAPAPAARVAGRPAAGRPAPGRLPQPVPGEPGSTSPNLREYEPGDDLRHIEWNVTARMDTPYVREYVEDREVTAWLLLDHSASMGFGPVDRQKDLVLAELATTLALVLTRRGNRVGMVVFDQDVERVLPARSGRNQVLQIADVLLDRRNARAAATEAASSDEAGPPPEPRRQRTRAPRHRPGRDAEPLRRDGPPSGPGRRRLRLHQRAGMGEAPWAGSPGATRWSPCRSATPVRTSCPTSARSTSRTPRPASRSSSTPRTPGSAARLRAAADERQALVEETTRSAGVDLHQVRTDEDLVRSLLRISELRRRRRR